MGRLGLRVCCAGERGGEEREGGWEAGLVTTSDEGKNTKESERDMGTNGETADKTKSIFFF